MSQVKSKFLGTDAQTLVVYFPAAFLSCASDAESAGGVGSLGFS